MSIEKHLLIGAGFVGLGMAKALKENNISYDQVDADYDLGGNWLHGVYRHVHIISSKKTTEYTDFPMPDNYPDFPSAQQVLDYLNKYAENFELRENITFNKVVTYVIPSGYETWKVSFKDGEVKEYKGVIVCNGHHWDKRMPEYSGKFTGEIIHSKDYKNESILENKRVLIIGGGNSACDIAVDAARVAKESHISLRRGYWFLPKSMLGIPTVEFIQPLIPVSIQRLILRFMLRLVIGKYEDYGLQKPDHKIFERHPTVNSLLLYYLKHGVIFPHPDIKSWNGNKVKFIDGTEKEFDLIVAATGFHVSFPFLPKGLIEIKKNIPQIPAGVVHDKYKGIYIVGWGQARYGVGPLITAAAPNICELIKVQDKLDRPVGMILNKLGIKALKTHLIDPMQIIKNSKSENKRIKKLPSLEKILFRNQTYQVPSAKVFQENKTITEKKYF